MRYRFVLFTIAFFPAVAFWATTYSARTANADWLSEGRTLRIGSHTRAQNRAQYDEAPVFEEGGYDPDYTDELGGYYDEQDARPSGPMASAEIRWVQGSPQLVVQNLFEDSAVGCTIHVELRSLYSTEVRHLSRRLPQTYTVYMVEGGRARQWLRADPLFQEARVLRQNCWFTQQFGGPIVDYDQQEFITGRRSGSVVAGPPRRTVRGQTQAPSRSRTFTPPTVVIPTLPAGGIRTVQ